MDRHPSLLNRLQSQLSIVGNSPQAEPLLLALAAGIGLASGLAVVCFRYLIGYFRNLLESGILESSFLGDTGSVALVPVLGGLLLSLLLWYYPLPTMGIGGILRAVEQRRIPFLQIPIKIVAAALSLGSGAALGPEGPSVELGGVMGAIIGQSVQLSTERIQLLVAAGVAAGLAAGFNAPIAGVFLALELVLAGSFRASTISVVVLSAVVSALVAQVGLGAQPAFMPPALAQPAFVLPAYEVRSLLELPFYLGLGFLASLVSIAFGYCLNWGKQLFQGQLPGLSLIGRLPPLLKPVLGGLCVGLLGLGIPLGLGIGYETVESILQNVPFSVSLLLLLLVGKLLMSAISLGSGFVGGIFAPSLFLGAVLGCGYGQVLNYLLPDTLQLAPPPAYAMVGMAAVLAGTVRAPLTAILLLFEMTRDYRIVLPLMAAVGISIWVVEQFHAPAVYSPAKPLTSGENCPVVTVAEVMIEPVRLPYGSDLVSAAQTLRAAGATWGLVMDEAQQPIGTVALSDLEHPLGLTLLANCQPIEHTLFADESLIGVIGQLLASPWLVVSRPDPSQIVGLLTPISVTQSFPSTPPEGIPEIEWVTGWVQSPVKPKLE